MNAPIDYQVIEHEGKPVSAVVDYAVFMDLLKLLDREDTVPHEVVKMVLGSEALTPIKAWRIYLSKTQADVAKTLGMSQAGYNQIENSEKPRKATLEKVAGALNITVGQLDV